MDIVKKIFIENELFNLLKEETKLTRPQIEKLIKKIFNIMEK